MKNERKEKSSFALAFNSFIVILRLSNLNAIKDEEN
jgi:hypothetical protein